MNRSLLLLALLALTGSLSAAPVAEGKLRRAVETWVRRATADRRHDAVIERLEPYKKNGVTVAYVVHLAGGGYCLAGADSLVLPVYWYNPKGNYDPTNPGSKEILEEIAARLDYLHTDQAKGGVVLRNHQDVLAKRDRLWDGLSVGEVSANAACEPTTNEPAGPGVLVLPLTSKWGQGSPYNDDCPAVPPGSDTHVAVGCVATATAQVMNYWRWPDTGLGLATHTYDYRWTSIPRPIALAMDPGTGTNWSEGRLGWTSDGFLWINGSWDASVLKAAKGVTNDLAYQNALQSLYDSLPQGQIQMAADFGATRYHWELLQDRHSDPVDDGDREIAKLCFHVGVALKMGYGLFESDGSHPELPLVANFWYDPSAIRESRDINRMVEEIQWQRPILLRGGNGSSGHMWVVYGCNLQTSPPQFKMNMGWDGGADGWYTVDCVPAGYTQSQGHVTRIAPLNMVRFVGASYPGNGSPLLPHQDIEEALNGALGGLNPAPDGATLIFKAGSVNTFSGPSLVIRRPLTLRGSQATIRRG